MQKIIESIQYFECGYCLNNLKTMFKDHQSEPRRFGAGVFLIKHRTQGYLLYDTGYSQAIYNKKLRLAVYRRLNPTFIDKSQMIDQQLIKAGVDPREIKRVVLSHLHPDHIGGISQFPHAEILISEAVYQTYRQPSIRDLVLKDQLPSDFSERVTVLKMTTIQPDFGYQASFDLFGDQSVLLTVLDGHAKGQLCLFFTEYQLFIGADTCWGIDLIDDTPNIRLIPSLIQHNMAAYQRSVSVIRQLLEEGIQVIVSHDSQERIQGILNG